MTPNVKRITFVMAMLGFLIAVFLLTFAGCASTQPPAPSPDNPCGVLNFAWVRADTVRMAQPMPDQWQCLHDVVGVRYVDKLNRESEGSDEPARALGIQVEDLSIQPYTNPGPGEIVGLELQPDPVKMARLEATLWEHKCRAGKGGVLAGHCVHAWDRTGIWGMEANVILNGWTKERAFEDAKARGFHVAYRGLVDYWEHWQPTPVACE